MATSTPARHEVIDSDGHVVEPDSLWNDYSEPEFREQLALPGGGYVQVHRDHARVPRHRDRAARPGRAVDDRWADTAGRVVGGGGAREDGTARAGTTRSARLVDMDDEGIDVAVLYPTAMLTWVEEADVFGAACRAYNNWLRDYCAAAPTRLYGVARRAAPGRRRRHRRDGAVRAATSGSRR